MNLCFTTDNLNNFISWFSDVKYKSKNNDFAKIVFSDIGYSAFILKDNSFLVIFNFDFVLPNFLPVFFFKYRIGKSLKSHGIKSSFVSYKQAVNLIVINGCGEIDCEPGFYL